MTIYPGMSITAGRDGRRLGTICAFVRLINEPEKVYLMSAHHVVAGPQHPKDAIIYLRNGERIARYERKTPFKKAPGIDVAYAILDDDVEFSNTIVDTSNKLENVNIPEIDDESSVMGGVTGEGTGFVMDIGDRVIEGEKYSIRMSKTNFSLEEGDSGSPWYSSNLTLLNSMHLGRMPSTTNEYRTLWLSRLFEEYNLELAD